VFDLIYYQGLTRVDAAGLLGVSERTVKRRWRAARLRLMERFGDRLPPGD
jgi:DNA-directed RNA polymerase specialized sigma24 family protein